MQQKLQSATDEVTSAQKELVEQKKVCDANWAQKLEEERARWREQVHSLQQPRGISPFRPLAVQAISMLCRLFCQSIVPAAGARLPYPRAHQILAHHRAKIPIQPQLLRELSPLPRSALPWVLHP